MTINCTHQDKADGHVRLAMGMFRSLALLSAFIPFSAMATATQPLVFQGHNENYWVGTYGCKGDPQETTELVGALKKALAAPTAEEANQGIQAAIQTYRGCIIGTSDQWTPEAKMTP